MSRLQVIRLLHTVVWAFFAACIIAIPFMAWAKRYHTALVLMGPVAVEIVVLAWNAWKCPLTAIAGRYTDDRRDSFDIYLPVWLARYNKQIFGTLFVAGVLLTIVRWLGWLE